MGIADEARAEAERQWQRESQFFTGKGNKEIFVAGAAWQASRNPKAAPSDTEMDYLFADPDPQPVQVEVTEEAVTTLAKHMANVASDWNHNDCGDDDHPLGHSNWEAYTDDARRALAALGGGDHAE